MSKALVTDGAVDRFSVLLYNGLCEVCESKLEWTADLDADGTTYCAECCGRSYFMRPETYRCYVELEVDDGS
jgi:hypothetical protein